MKKGILSIVVTLFWATFLWAQNQTSTFKDTRDGKVYKIVKIGNNWWFSENLSFKIDNSWAYNNDESFVKTYGRLYTLKAAENACPSGWHLATRAEWIALAPLNEERYLGGKLKAKTLWKAPNNGATNSMGFNGLPAGYRDEDGTFTDMGKIATFWNTTEANGNKAWRYYLLYNNEGISTGLDKQDYGFSVRCVKDN